jgi:DNA-binding SARP family transcriptional activator
MRMVALQFQLLGPVQMIAEGAGEQPGRQRSTVLAALLLSAGRVVAVDGLVDALWGSDTSPKSAVGRIHDHIHGLRRVLDATSPGAGSLIVTRPPGYLYAGDPRQVDLTIFRELVPAGRAALVDGRPAEAAALLRQGLGLWRGPALGGVTAMFAETQAYRLEEERLAALDYRIEADLARGRHRELIAELTGLLAEHPLRERLRGGLMLALYRAGRQADALEVYRQGRAALVTQLGLEPGKELQELHTAMLNEDEHLSLPVPATTPSSDTVRVGSLDAEGNAATPAAPRQSPRRGGPLIGRRAELAAVESAMSAATAGVVQVSGPAGVGKTAFVIELAHRLADRFPDGQLYAELRGVAAPVDPAEILAGFLRALEPGATMPGSVEQRAARFRQLVADRRMLIVLDDVHSDDQVRPVLPAGSGVAVLMTSRRRLSGPDDALPLELRLLSADDAVELLRRSLGPERVDAEPLAAYALVDHCGLLPLAVHIAAARLRARPHWTLSRLADLLADERRRLAELAVGNRAVRASLSLSYRQLPERVRLGYRCLGLLHAVDVPAWALAAMLQVDEAAALDALDCLVDARLVEPVTDPPVQVRYRMHDLVRLDARERADEEDDPAERSDRLVRALRAWAYLARRAADRLPGGHQRADVVLPALTAPSPLDGWPCATTQDEALDWFTGELPALRGALRQAEAIGQDALVIAIAAETSPFHQLRHNHDDWAASQAAALGAARRIGDVRAEAASLRALGELRIELCDLAAATPLITRARQVSAGAGDRSGEGYALHDRAIIHRLAGELEDAVSVGLAAADLLRKVGVRLGKADALFNVAMAYLGQGQASRAADLVTETVAVFNDFDDQHSLARAYRVLGMAVSKLGLPAAAERHFQRSRDLCAELGDRAGVGYAVLSIAEVWLDGDQPERAGELLPRCLAQFIAIDDQFGVNATRLAQGRLDRRLDRLAPAHDNLRRALAYWRSHSLALYEARTLRELGEVHAQRGETAVALDVWSRALVLLQRLDAVDAAGVMERMHRYGWARQEVTAPA